MLIIVAGKECVHVVFMDLLVPKATLVPNLCMCSFFRTISQGQILVQLDVETLSNERCYFAVLSCHVMSFLCAVGAR